MHKGTYRGAYCQQKAITWLLHVRAHTTRKNRNGQNIGCSSSYKGIPLCALLDAQSMTHNVETIAELHNRLTLQLLWW